MAKYLHSFETESAFNAAYNGNDYLEPWVSYTDEIEGQGHVDYNKEDIVVFSIDNVDITGFSGPGIIDLTDIGFDPAFKYGVEKSVWPDGVKYRLEFPLPHDSSLEGPYMGTDSETFRIEDGRYVNVGTEGWRIAQEDGDEYSWEGHNEGLENYWFFRTQYNGIQ